MEGRRSNSKRNQANASVGDEIVRRKKGNKASASKMEVVRRKEGNQASASEGGEILRRKKEMVEATLSIAAEGMYGVKFAMEEAEAGKMKRTKVVKTRVPQKFIEYMMRTPHPICDELSEDELAKHTEEFREGYAKRKFKSDKIRAYYDALLDQYKEKGFAEDEAEVEVTDDDEEN